MLPLRAGLRTGELAGKCAAPGYGAQLRCSATAHAQDPGPLLPTRSCHSTHAHPQGSGSFCIPRIAMEIPKGQGGELEPLLAVTMAVGGQLLGQQTMLLT
ncbi:Hypothetical predicted protein [Marmota monax]|uniref:Uncharacterized protein n=1 Tax=Marmota monax TaxID=9995 RepID=A0A5E4B7E3_MARMO|nr:Hypothetical predicted protein [Marmota monax]